MFTRLSRKLWRLCSRLRRHIKPRIIISKFRKLKARACPRRDAKPKRPALRPIRIATFNAAMFSLAPVIPAIPKLDGHDEKDFTFMSPPEGSNWVDTINFSNHPKSILKHSPLHHKTSTSPQHLSSKTNWVTPKSKRKVSIDLPDDEITLARRSLIDPADDETGKSSPSSSRKVTGNYRRSNIPVRSPLCFPAMANWWNNQQDSMSGRSILEVLSEVDADVLALQDVKAEEEKGMKPLSDLAAALGMNYVFAESWAPEYGNAVLSKWPIKRWNVRKIVDDEDFRNVLKATIDVPWMGEIEFHCTQLDHLDESWRMKQVNAIIRTTDCPHILAGGLNSLSRSDYSSERWTEITKYYEEMGKPAPKLQVMKFLKDKGYADAGDSAGDCEPAVVIAKGQNMQGTSKYGTRVDYILASSDSLYKFVPGSYSVVSSKGTSDHHIVKVEVVRHRKQNAHKQHQKTKPKAVRKAYFSSSRGI